MIAVLLIIIAGIISLLAMEAFPQSALTILLIQVLVQLAILLIFVGSS